VGTLNLEDGTLLVDPSWDSAPALGVVGSLSAPAVPNADYTTANGNIGVGQNAMLSIGINDGGDWIKSQVQSAGGLSENGLKAALGIWNPVQLGTGKKLVVDGGDPQTTLADKVSAAGANTATFAADSLLVVRADAAQTAAGALSAESAATATVAAGAKLRIAGAKVGEEYKVLGTNITTNYADDTAWNGDNLSASLALISLQRKAGVDGTFVAAYNAAAEAGLMPGLDKALVKAVRNMVRAGQYDWDATAAGARFLSRALDTRGLGNNPALVSKTIESAARFAEAGAVPQMTMAASEAAAGVVTQRTSLASPRSELRVMRADGTVEPDQGIRKLGAALWIIPLYQSRNTFGMEAGNFDLDQHGGLGGIALGADYTFENAFRFGVAFNLGGGYAEGGGDLAKTTNSFTFWGLGAYAGWLYENFGLTADINYTSTYNEVKQDLPSQMNMRNLQGDITAHALGAGLRAEYRFETPVLDITPHAGVRYMHLLTDSYDVKSNGTALKGEQMQRNIWTFPVGLTFSKSIQTDSAWFVKPSLDLAVIPAAGDIKKSGTVRFTGTDTKADLESRVMDYISYSGGLGLEFGNRNLSFGVNYNIQASEHTTGHGVFGTFRYEF
jgi:uncharacterized protein with beta-barrel porin domain